MSYDVYDVDYSHERDTLYHEINRRGTETSVIDKIYGILFLFWFSFCTR